MKNLTKNDHCTIRVSEKSEELSSRVEAIKQLSKEALTFGSREKVLETSARLMQRHIWIECYIVTTATYVTVISGRLVMARGSSPGEYEQYTLISTDFIK